QVPVPPHPEPGVVEHGDVARRQLEDVPVDAAGRGDVLDREILRERLGIELARDAAVRSEALQLAPEDASRGAGARRGEERAAVRERVVERLLAQAIAGEDEAPVA